MSCLKEEHCWHSTGFQQPLGNPNYGEVCCWCGEERWVKQGEATLHGTMCKLKEDDVREIRRRAAEGETHRALAASVWIGGLFCCDEHRK